jgi:hypothetical protein
MQIDPPERPLIGWYLAAFICLAVVIVGVIESLVGSGSVSGALGAVGGLGFIGLGMWLKKSRSS